MFRLVASIFFIGVFTVKGQSISDINSNNIMQYLTSSAGSADFRGDVKSQSLVIQQGNYNVAEMYLIDDKVASIQSGDSNTIYYRDSNASQASQMMINLQGNNNLVQVDGSNSISNGMSIEIIGNNKAVFVENR